MTTPTQTITMPAPTITSSTLTMFTPASSMSMPASALTLNMLTTSMTTLTLTPTIFTPLLKKSQFVDLSSIFFPKVVLFIREDCTDEKSDVAKKLSEVKSKGK